MTVPQMLLLLLLLAMLAVGVALWLRPRHADVDADAADADQDNFERAQWWADEGQGRTDPKPESDKSAENVEDALALPPVRSREMGERRSRERDERASREEDQHGSRAREEVADPTPSGVMPAFARPPRDSGEPDDVDEVSDWFEGAGRRTSRYVPTTGPISNADTPPEEMWFFNRRAMAGGSDEVPPTDEPSKALAARGLLYSHDVAFGDEHRSVAPPGMYSLPAVLDDNIEDVEILAETLLPEVDSARELGNVVDAELLESEVPLSPLAPAPETIDGPASQLPMPAVFSIDTRASSESDVEGAMSPGFVGDTDRAEAWDQLVDSARSTAHPSRTAAIDRLLGTYYPESQLRLTGESAAPTVWDDEAGIRSELLQDVEEAPLGQVQLEEESVSELPVHEVLVDEHPSNAEPLNPEPLNYELVEEPGHDDALEQQSDVPAEPTDPVLDRLSDDLANDGPDGEPGTEVSVFTWTPTEDTAWATAGMTGMRRVLSSSELTLAARSSAEEWLARYETRIVESRQLARQAELEREEERARLEAEREAEREEAHRQELAAMEAERARLEAEREEEVARLEAERARLEAEREEEVARLEAERARLEAEREEEVARLEAERARLEAELEDAHQQELAERESELQRLRDENDRLAEEQAALQQQRADLEAAEAERQRTEVLERAARAEAAAERAEALLQQAQQREGIALASAQIAEERMRQLVERLERAQLVAPPTRQQVASSPADLVVDGVLEPADEDDVLEGAVIDPPAEIAARQPDPGMSASPSASAPVPTAAQAPSQPAPRAVRPPKLRRRPAHVSGDNRPADPSTAPWF